MIVLHDDGAAVTDTPNMVPILANSYALVYRTDEGRNHLSLPEPSAIMNALHKKLIASSFMSPIM